MRIVKPYENGKLNFSSLTEDYMKNSIFLAGPCPRKNYEDDWRFEAFDILEELGFGGTVLSPTNDHYMEMRNQHNDMFMKQTEWEYKAMCTATAIVFWIPRSEEHPAFTTNLELGQWWGKKGVYVGFPNDSWKNEYIDWTRYEKRFEEASYNANKYQNALNHAWESLKNLTEDPIGTIINNSDFAVRQLQTEINREQRNVLRQANPTTIQANGSMSLNWSIYGNKLKFIVREPRNEIKQAINSIYYRYGYTTDEYTSLTDNIINSRRYFNYVKGDINIATSVSLEKNRYISQDAIADVLERFKSGVTILHTHSDLTSTANVIDVDCFKFEYENWEDFIAYGGLF